ncbi:MFS superfamily [Mycena sanguinolenta]|uniref:MFS superfamily n=1 Tax=Mycena sanguinolenta TaxID=230812 RepID=A0A8H6YSJ9_9AGAR|nr:MFS superfamily [Mycena sanguinolenta]
MLSSRRLKTSRHIMDAEDVPHQPPPASSSSSDALFTNEFIFFPIPKHLRYYPQKSFHFGLFMNVSMGFVSTVTAANLYYSQPLLIEIASAFDVSYSKVAEVPTLLQAGYAVGVVFLSPLGDLVRRRQLILQCLLLSTVFTVGLAVTNSFVAFEILSFFVGVSSILTAILQPLVADLAPPDRRATAISVVISGLLLGVLVARVLAGVLGQFSSWRAAYYYGVGVQALSLAWLYFILPDYPAKNAGADLTYSRILWTMMKFSGTEPALIQSGLINFATSAGFTNFWVTLTFLLGGPLYNYSTLDIGLFGLVGMLGVVLGPFMGRLIDLLYPWYSTLFATILLGVFNSVQMGAGGLNVAAVLIVAFGLNLFRQLLQASLATTVLSISVEARGRLNAINILAIFMGQVMGTSVGSNIFLNHGWRACAAFSVGLSGAQLIILLVRGPHCRRYTWFGWEGGWMALRSRSQRLDAQSEKPPDVKQFDQGAKNEVGKEDEVERETQTSCGRREDVVVSQRVN